MSRTRWLVLLISVVTPSTFAVLLLAALRPSTVTQATLGSVKDGQIEAKVEEIFGSKATLKFQDSKGILGIWEGRDGAAQILFDKDSKVIGKLWIESNEGVLDIVWRRVFVDLMRRIP